VNVCRGGKGRVAGCGGRCRGIRASGYKRCCIADLGEIGAVGGRPGRDRPAGRRRLWCRATMSRRKTDVRLMRVWLDVLTAHSPQAGGDGFGFVRCDSNSSRRCPPVVHCVGGAVEGLETGL